MKNWRFWTVVLYKTLESPLDYKEIQTANAKENQSWIFIGRTDAEVESPIFWPTDVKNLLTVKDLITGKDWGQGEKRTTEDEMVGWHHQLDAHEFEQVQMLVKESSPEVLQSMGLQRVGHDWATELNWTYPIANAICNWRVSPARLGLPKAPTHIPNQVCTKEQKSVPDIHKAFSEFWLQGDLHFSRHKGVKDTFILLSQTTPK